MKVTRRQFIKTTAGAAGALAASGILLKPGRAYAFVQSPNFQLWQTTLRGVGPGGIPVATPDRSPAPVTRVTHYTIDIKTFTDNLYTNAFGPTTLWGFQPTSGLGGFTGPAHLGGIIVAERNVPIQITFKNTLPPHHPIPIDTTVPGDFSAVPPGQNNRIAVHMHGGRVPWISDGGPFDWWTPTADHGLSFLNNAVLNPRAAGDEAEYYYPMNQPARMMWYHDHAFGMDRATAYAGVASALVIRDTPGLEGNLRSQGLPDFVELGGREIPIVFQDKIFCGPDIRDRDPFWEGSTAHPGDLWYAHTYDTARYGKLGPNPLGPPPEPSTVPEFFGDTMLTNGTVYPQVNVEPRRYRLRILNACNSRFMNLQLYVADGTLLNGNGITLNNAGNPINAPALNAAAPDPTGRPTANWFVIGTEGGFLPRPAYVPTNRPFGGPTIGSLILAPAERADVIFDFSPHAGKSLILYSDAPAPFPFGDPRNDYFPGLNNKNPVNALTAAGFGPNTRVIMRFNVGTNVTSPADEPLGIDKAFDLTEGNDPLLAPGGVIPAAPPVAMTRQLTLNESFDGYGRLIQKLGTNVRQPDGTFGQGYLECGTTGGERPNRNDIEVWQIANLTGDTHPIHFHLVDVQIISRQPFQVSAYKGTPNYQGPPVPPAPFEAGWKETVRMNPGEVTTIMMKFNLPRITDPHGNLINTQTTSTQLAITNGLPPVSPRTGGHEYVWHCHILEHEEHDMMRPMVVL